jgi:hypothetical protein
MPALLLYACKDAYRTHACMVVLMRTCAHPAPCSLATTPSRLLSCPCGSGRRRVASSWYNVQGSAARRLTASVWPRALQAVVRRRSPAHAHSIKLARPISVVHLPCVDPFNHVPHFLSSLLTIHHPRVRIPPPLHRHPLDRPIHTQTPSPNAPAHMRGHTHNTTQHTHTSGLQGVPGGAAQG